MSEEEAIKQIEDLILDRESFIQNDKEHDDIFLKDIQALKTVLQLLEQKDNKINKAISKLKENMKNNIKNAGSYVRNEATVEQERAIARFEESTFTLNRYMVMEISELLR